MPEHSEKPDQRHQVRRQVLSKFDQQPLWYRAGGEKNTQDLTLYQTRISVLWLLAIVGLFAYAKFAADFIYTKLVTDQEVASVSLVMMALAFLSLTLKGSTNRWTNIIGGSVIGLGTLIVLIDAVTLNLYGIYNLMMGAVVVIMVSIVWFAYKMPR